MRGLMCFKLPAKAFGLGGRHHPDRRVVAMLAVVLDCRLGKDSYDFLILYMIFILHI